LHCYKINPFVDFETCIQDPISINDESNLFENLDLIIVADDRFNPKYYDYLNKICIKLGIKWTSCVSSGLKGYIGPTIIPKQTACYHCFESRLNSNMLFYNEFNIFKEHLKIEGASREYGKLVMFFGILSNIMSLEIIKILTGITSPLTFSTQMTFDFTKMTSEFHPVLKLPRCTECGHSSRKIPTNNPWME
jgi:molybdopterin-synthase adenylyltransferase